MSREADVTDTAAAPTGVTQTPTEPADVARQQTEPDAAARPKTEPADGTRPRAEPAGVASPGAAPARRWWLVGALVAGFVLHVAWRLWLARNLIAPAAHADEDGYLLAARALAGDAGGYSTENDLFRRAGYPLFLAPIYWFTDDAFAVYRSAQVVNALVNAATFPLAYLFARRVFGLRRGWALGGGFAVAAMPAVTFYSPFAMADSMLAAIALGWLLLMHAWLTAATGRARVLAAVGAGALAGLIYAMHVRGIMVVLAHGAVTVALLLLRRVSWRAAGAAVAGATTGVVLDLVLKQVLGDSIIVAGNSPRSQTVNALTTFGGAARTVTRVVGQLWYLAVGTWGLGAFALVALAAWLWPLWPPRQLRARLARRDATTAASLIMLTTLVTTLLVAAGSAISLPTWDLRLNYFAYPRYIHFLFPVWTLAGLAGLLALRGARVRRIVVPAAAAAGLTVVLGVPVVAALRHTKAYRFMSFDSPEITFLQWDWTQLTVRTPTLLGVALLAVLVVALTRRRLAVVALVAILALNVAVADRSVAKISEPMVTFQYLPGTPRLVRDAGLHPGDIVAESTTGPWYLRYNHMREIWWHRLLLFDNSKQPPPAEANVVIAPYRSPRPSNWVPGPEWRLVAADPPDGTTDHGWGVWRRTP